MSLEEQTKNILHDFENTSSGDFLEILNQIKPKFQSNLTLEYLEGKIKKIADVSSENEKKKQCRALMPYLDWYLQGL